MSLLQLTNILSAILEVVNERQLLDYTLKTALAQRSATEQHQIWFFAHSLCESCCKSKCDSISTITDKHSQPLVTVADGKSKDTGKETQTSRLNAHVVTNSKRPKPVTKASTPKLHSVKTTGQQNDDIKQSEKPDGLVTAISEPIVEPRGRSERSRSIISSISPQGQGKCDRPSREPCSYRCGLIDQDADDFVQESQEQIRLFASFGNSEETYKHLLDLLNDDMTDPQECEARWSNCSEWLYILESGYSERKRGTIRYAVTAIAFARWHASQVRLVAGEITAQQASQQVSARILGPHRREQQRKRLGTHLARGRKWLRLVQGFGSGILFKEAWFESRSRYYERANKLTCDRKLAKSPESVVDKVIKELPNNPRKMTVLRLLGDQMTLLLQGGATNPELFREKLHKEGLIPSDSIAPTGFTQLDELYGEIRHSITDGKLNVKCVDYKFHAKSLLRFSGNTWLNDELILACLHLSAKLPHVRIGMLVPIHQETGEKKRLKRPFQMARKRIEEWRRQAKERNDLVYLFPIIQNNNHFSLLEMIENKHRINHYDSFRRRTKIDVKVRSLSEQRNVIC
jgi:hypothetical protein